MMDYDETIRLAPTNRAAYNNRGNVYMSKRQYDRAIADFRKALTMKVDEPVKRQIETALKELGAAG
jgi:tetratricopeptide (TPR) repeat protein